MPKSIRRIVTSQDASGRSYALFDAPADNGWEIPHRKGVFVTQLWETRSMPVRLEGDADHGAGPIVLEPPANGSTVRFVEFPPESQYLAAMDPDKARQGFSAMGAAHAAAPGAAHPLMHSTRTVDYEICLSGEIYLVLDKSEHLMRPGDIAIQRGTRHAWANRSTAPCLMAFIQLDAKHEPSS
jgi:quercetin dioxygenase-like cupin family protein